MKNEQDKNFKNEDDHLLGLAFMMYMFGDRHENTKLNKLMREIIEEVKNNLDDILSKYSKEKK